MPNRVHITALVNGGHEIRISEADRAELGMAGLVAAIEGLTIGGETLTAENLGEPEHFPFRRRWVIPVISGGSVGRSGNGSNQSGIGGLE